MGVRIEPCGTPHEKQCLNPTAQAVHIESISEKVVCKCHDELPRTPSGWERSEFVSGTRVKSEESSLQWGSLTCVCQSSPDFTRAAARLTCCSPRGQQIHLAPEFWSEMEGKHSESTQRESNKPGCFLNETLHIQTTFHSSSLKTSHIRHKKQRKYSIFGPNSPLIINKTQTVQNNCDAVNICEINRLKL